MQNSTALDHVMKFFGVVWGASGVQNFFGQGWPFHKTLKKWFPKGFDFAGMTFVSKTSTLDERMGEGRGGGNMPLDEETLMPIEERPRCIFVSPWSWIFGLMLNAVGLSGPGLKKILDGNYPELFDLYGGERLQARAEPFFLSFMSVAQTKEERLEQVGKAVETFLSRKREFRALVGWQHNISCPNIKHEEIPWTEHVCEVKETLAILAQLNVPVVLKIDALTPVWVGLEFASDPNCHGICVSNTIAWKRLPWWIRVFFFGKLKKSPLHEYNGGGLSGAGFLRRKTLSWIREFRKENSDFHINGGGGILAPRHVRQFYQAGASSVSLGSIAILRPWRVKKCIKEAHKLWSSDQHS